MHKDVTLKNVFIKPFMPVLLSDKVIVSEMGRSIRRSVWVAEVTAEQNDNRPLLNPYTIYNI